MGELRGDGQIVCRLPEGQARAVSQLYNFSASIHTARLHSNESGRIELDATLSATLGLVHGVAQMGA